MPGYTHDSERFEALAKSWDAQHDPFSARRREFQARTELLRELCRLIDFPRVLDLGCATGATLACLADLISDGVGVDFAPEMISEARKKASDAGLRFFVADAAEFCASTDERFELVLFAGVLGHLEDQSAAMAGAARVLAPHGRVAIIEPHPFSPQLAPVRLLEWIGRIPPATHPSPGTLCMLAQQHGLELASIDPLPFSLWPRFPSLEIWKQRPPFTSKKLRTGILSGAYMAVFVSSSWQEN